MASAAPEIPVLARDQAFEHLYRRHVKDVYHYALALLRNPADAEDVTQTTFMNAYRAYKRGETPIKPVLQLLKKNKWKIPANIEYEYKGVDTVAEVKKCFEFAKQALA